MYKVVKMFDDLQDGKSTKTGAVYHRYNVGDLYPREGVDPSPERIAELASANNRRGMPLIEPLIVPEEEPFGEEAPLDSLKKAELAEIAEGMGIDVPAKATKADIIALIQEMAKEQ